MFRQGDVLVVPISGKLKDGLTLVPREGGKIILAEGEVTGHYHAIAEEGVALLEGENDDDRYLQVETEEAHLTHNEHGTLTIPKGNYKVTRQVEYTPQEVRRVAD